MIEFKDWFWGKFEEWRKGTTNGPTAFARYLGLPQPKVSEWLAGKYKPQSQSHISRLAQFYPDVYEVLGLERVEQEVSFDQLPAVFGDRLAAAIKEIEQTLTEKKVDRNSPEGVDIASCILRSHGFDVNVTE